MKREQKAIDNDIAALTSTLLARASLNKLRIKYYEMFYSIIYTFIPKFNYFNLENSQNNQINEVHARN